MRPRPAAGRRTESRAVRWGAHRRWRSLFLLCFLFVPLAAVFAQAFADGARAYWRALTEPTRWRRCG